MFRGLMPTGTWFTIDGPVRNYGPFGQQKTMSCGTNRTTTDLLPSPSDRCLCIRANAFDP